MNSSQLANILLKNSTNKFYIEYGGYLVNHMSHGIVALARLGASTERLERFVDWYRSRLEEPGKFKTSTAENQGELLGARQSFYFLVDTYKEQLEKCDGSLERLVKEKFPTLLPGLIGSALHGVIHLGYGYAAKSPQVVCEGLAYMHYSYMPLKPASGFPEKEIGKGTCNILDVINDVKNNTELTEFMKEKSECKEYKKLHIGDFSRRVKSLYDYRSDDLLRYAYRIQIPICAEMELLDNEVLCRSVLTWLLDVAIKVYAFSEKQDFFLLHGVTAAWSVLQVGPVAVGKSRKLTQELVSMYLCALIATYISQRVPNLCAESISDDVVAGNSWASLIDDAFSDDYDEHAYKVLQICYELSQDSVLCLEDTNDDELKNLYFKAAYRAIKEPYVF